MSDADSIPRNFPGAQDEADVMEDPSIRRMRRFAEHGARCRYDIDTLSGDARIVIAALDAAQARAERLRDDLTLARKALGDISKSARNDFWRHFIAGVLRRLDRRAAE